MIKALVFDCFGVFYADPVLMYARSTKTPPEKAGALLLLDDQAARGEIDKSGFITQAAAMLGISRNEAEQRFLYGDNRDTRLVDFVQELRKTYKVAMLSNIGGDMMDGFFTPEERQRLFDTVVLSGDVKIAKPDRLVFELVCGRLGVKLHEAVVIDDRLPTCRAVRGFGMQSVWYKDFEQCKMELTSILKLSVP